MNSMHRQFGKLMSKGPGNSAKVSVLLNDYEDADKALAKLIDAAKGWRDAWVSILSCQLNAVAGFEELYNPIVGTSDGHRDNPVMTPQLQLDRTLRLKETYTDLKTDLMEEVMMMDSRVIRPAMDAKEYIQPIRKTIKKRENKRLDWERYIDKVNSLNKKLKRSEKENAALAKVEEELARASDAFKLADDHLRETLPPIVTTAFSILPHLLAVQIMIQNSLLAQTYTAVHNYCEDMGFPSPPPPMADVIAVWEASFKPIQKEAESIQCIARGKAVHQPMALGDDASGRKSLQPRSGLTHRGSSPSSPNPNARVMRIPSSNSIPLIASPAAEIPEPSYSSSVGAKKKPPPPPPKRIGFQGDFLYAVALYAFAGQGEGDLSFQEGDRIRVIKKTDSTDDWWQGELRGVKGSFPANYCKLS